MFPMKISTRTGQKELDRFLHGLKSFSVLVTDSNETILCCNEAFQEVSGYEMKELTGCSIRELVEFGEAGDSLYRHYSALLDSGEEVPKIKLKLRNGEWISTEYAILRQGNHAQDHYIFLMYDLWPGKQSQLLRQFAETFFREVNLGVILIDAGFKMVGISDMACEILGVEREQVMYRSLDDIFADVPVEHRLIQRTILEGVLTRNQAVSWTINQERHELLMDSYLLRDSAGNVMGAYVLFKDVTNLRSLEEQIQRSDRLAMIGQIAAGTAHEIRNPLTSIKGFLQVLRRSFVEQGMEKEQSYTDIMLTEINRINALVSELLLLSKPKHTHFESIDIANVLREILPIIHNEAILHNVNVQYRASLSMPKVIADRELLKQVFLNLSKNGIEAMVANGTLIITERVDEVEKKVYVDIQDSGPGIPAYLIDKIFDPFFTTKENGTGLGLSVCQKIIHDLGGTIRVSSKGYGTIFTVGIPYYSW